jgi:hypothetical protein
MAFPPLPAYLMAAVYAVFSPDLVYVRYLDLALGILTCMASIPSLRRKSPNWSSRSSRPLLR